MRFEIRAGGALLILIGLAALSGVVFALGLVAGYEMARQTSPEGTQVANVYPVPSVPQNAQASAEPSPAEASAAPPAAEANPAQPVPPPASAAPSIAQSQPAAKPVAKAVPLAPNRNAVAATTQPRDAIAPPSRPLESDENTDESESAAPATSVSAPKYASASVPNPGRHKPFNIQIDAVMDYANAQQMASRLQRLGYHAFLVPTDIDGQRWWRVRIGPYNSSEEAQSAEQQLRERYRGAYAQ